MIPRIETGSESKSTKCGLSPSQSQAMRVDQTTPVFISAKQSPIGSILKLVKIFFSKLSPLFFGVAVPYRSHADTSNCAAKAKPEKSRWKRVFLSQKTKKIAIFLPFAHSVTTNREQHDKLARTAPEHSLDRRYR